MNDSRDIKGKVRGFIGVFLSIVAISTYLLLIFSFQAFINSILLLGLIVVLPTIIVALFKKKKKRFLKRCKAGCWALGCLILLLFPAFWLIPNQAYVRLNRQSTLVTPDAPAVIEASAEFLAVSPTYNTSSFEEKALMVTDFVLEKVEWKLDYETYGIAGHVGTPTQCLTLGADDCQGQACTLASLLINLGFPHVWTVETPFHWYVIVRDPSLGALPPGWEKNVENLQDSGEVLTLNRDGRGTMPSYRWEKVLLIFNNEETLHPVNAFEAIWISWTATGFFVHEVFPIYQSFEFMFLVGAIFILGAFVTQYSSCMMSKKPRKERMNRKVSLAYFLKKWIVTSCVILTMFLLWYALQPLIWDYTLLMTVSGISIISLLGSEDTFWKKLRIKKE